MIYMPRALAALIVIAAVFLLISMPSVNADEIEKAPADPDISDICTLSDCNPTKPCLDENERCYTLNGVFYCCIMPPSGGAQSVGE